MFGDDDVTAILQSLYTTPPPAPDYAEGYAACRADAVKEVRKLRELLHSQLEALDISREIAVYSICEDAITKLKGTER